MSETATIKREVFFEIGDRLDKLLSDVAIVLPPPKITQQQALEALCDDNSPETLKTLARLLADLEPLLSFLEAELVPALVESNNDMNTISGRKALKREELKREDEKPRVEPKSGNEKPPAESKVEASKSESPKPVEQKEIPKKKGPSK